MQGNDRKQVLQEQREKVEQHEREQQECAGQQQWLLLNAGAEPEIAARIEGDPPRRARPKRHDGE